MRDYFSYLHNLLNRVSFDGFVQVFIAVSCVPVVSFRWFRSVVSVVLLVSFRCFDGFGGFVPMVSFRCFGFWYMPL